MELFSPKFKKLILEVLNSSKTVLAIIKSGLAREWVPEIKDKDVYNFELIRGNFEEVFAKILAIISR